MTQIDAAATGMAIVARWYSAAARGAAPRPAAAHIAHGGDQDEAHHESLQDEPGDGAPSGGTEGRGRVDRDERRRHAAQRLLRQA